MNKLKWVSEFCLSDVPTLPVRVRRRHAHSHLVLFHCDVRLLLLLVFPVTGAVTAQQYHPRDQEEQERAEAQIQRLSDLPLLRLHHHRVVEVSDDGVSGPGDGKKSGEASDHEQTPAHQQDHVLTPGVISGSSLCPSSRRRTPGRPGRREWWRRTWARGPPGCPPAGWAASRRLYTACWCPPAVCRPSITPPTASPSRWCWTRCRPSPSTWAWRSQRWSRPARWCPEPEPGSPA